MTGYRVNIPPTSELHRREIELRIAMLRDMHVALDMKELWFSDMDALLAYVNDVAGLRTVRDRRVSEDVVRRWHKTLGFPLYRSYGRKTLRIATSNILIMAWVWAFRVYRATRTERPNQRDLVDATGHLV